MPALSPSILDREAPASHPLAFRESLCDLLTDLYARQINLLSHSPYLRVHSGRSDPQVVVDEARAWTEHTTTHCTLTTCPGGHSYLNAHLGGFARNAAPQLPGHVERSGVF